MKFIRRIYYPVITTLSKICGYTTGPMLHYLLCALLAVAFAYGYFSSLAGVFNFEFFILAMGVVLPIVVVIHWLSFGGLFKIGLPSIYPIVRRIDAKMNGNQLNKELSYEQLEELLKDLTFLPVLRLFTPILDSTLYLIPVVLLNQYYFKLPLYFELIQAAVVVLPVLMAYSFVTTDLYAMVTRAHIRRRIFIKGKTPRHYRALSLKLKGVIQLVIGVVSVFIILKLKEMQMVNAENSDKVLLFSLVALVNFGLISYMLFLSVFQAISDLARSAKMIEKGENAGMFSGTSDRELVELSAGLFRASQTMLHHQQELERTVQQRTATLEERNNLLQDFRKTMIMELSLAADIQAGIYPRVNRWNFLKIDHLHRPLQPVSGDYYDVMTGDNSVIILTADASGHGVPAALVTMAAKQALQEARLTTHGTAEFLSVANQLLLDRLHTQDYLTIFAMKVDGNGNMTYTNAAHPPPMLYRGQTREVEMLDTEGVSLGMLPEDDFRYEEKTLRLEKGDRILLYTDGVTEIASPTGIPFGETRIRDFFKECATMEPNALLSAIHLELENHLAGEPPRDDISMLLITVDQ